MKILFFTIDFTKTHRPSPIFHLNTQGMKINYVSHGNSPAVSIRGFNKCDTTEKCSSSNHLAYLCKFSRMPQLHLFIAVCIKLSRVEREALTVVP